MFRNNKAGRQASKNTMFQVAMQQDHNKDRVPDALAGYDTMIRIRGRQRERER
jgi:hypothetical protein